MGTIGADLSGKTCVVTGAARSIGLAIAEAYRAAGARVAMIDLNPEVAAQAERLAEGGAPVKGYVLDITNRAGVLECFERIAAELGRSYALVNNAGLVDQRPIEETTPELLDRIFRVNVYGTIYCIQGVLAGMRRTRDGKIINFSSKSGKTGSALMAPYSAAKGAVIALTQALAFELASDQHQGQLPVPRDHRRHRRLVGGQQGLHREPEAPARGGGEEVHRQGSAGPAHRHPRPGGLRPVPHGQRRVLHRPGVQRHRRTGDALMSAPVRGGDRVVYRAPKEVVIERMAEPPSPGRGELLVRVEACAICGTDIKSFHKGNPRILPPQTMGHEFVGTVEALGGGRAGTAAGGAGGDGHHHRLRRVPLLQGRPLQPLSQRRGHGLPLPRRHGALGDHPGEGGAARAPGRGGRSGGWGCGAGRAALLRGERAGAVALVGDPRGAGAGARTARLPPRPGGAGQGRAGGVLRVPRRPRRPGAGDGVRRGRPPLRAGWRGTSTSPATRASTWWW